MRITSLFALLIAVFVPEAATHAATFVVDTTSDVNLRACSAAPDDCSLRGAIANSNFNVGADTIAFNIPGSGYKTIAPTSALPTLSDTGTFIDGHSQPGYRSLPLIILSGSRVSELTPAGIRIAASQCRVRGLTLHGWDTAIDIAGAGAHSNQIEGCFIGTGADGSSAVGNSYGVTLRAGAHSNSIGGASRNVISGNARQGILITGTGSNRNRVFNSIIGLNVDGDRVLGNGMDGIRISDGAQRCTIGSFDPALRNVISGSGFTGDLNFGRGIYLLGSETAFHTIINTYIGTDFIGNQGGFGNKGQGILLFGAHSNRIGVAEAPRNVISGNNESNIMLYGSSRNVIQNNVIGPKANGSGPLLDFNGNLTRLGIEIRVGETESGGNIIGGLEIGARNIISGHAEGGIVIGGGINGTRIQGNFIGINPGGNAPLPNSRYGIHDLGAGTLIGGASHSARNFISGNGPGSFSAGVILDGVYSVVQGNYIGTDARGLTALPGQAIGIHVRKTAVIGGATIWPGTGAGNVISGNTSVGILMQAEAQEIKDMRILGNIIGADSLGRLAVPNGEGIRVGSSRDTAIGNGQRTGRNVISGNSGAGIRIGVDGIAFFTRIQSNYIGTDISARRALPNLRGIQLDNARVALIGGAASPPGTQRGNIISGNLLAGIIGSPQALAGSIQGNAIGVASDGKTPLPNRSVDGVGGWGVYVSSSGTHIGEPGALANLIAYNEAAGVTVVSVQDRAYNNRIRGNRIFKNLGLGIDLDNDGPTLNDESDADGGTNNRQNFPVLISAMQNSPDAPLVLSGTLDSAPDRLFAIDVYASSVPDSSGFGEGEIYLGSFFFSTSRGLGRFNQSLDVDGDLSGQFISLAATELATNSSSEFGPVVEVNASAVNLGAEAEQTSQ